MAVGDGVSEGEKGSWLVVCVRAVEWVFGRNVDTVVHLADVKQMSR